LDDVMSGEGRGRAARARIPATIRDAATKIAHQLILVLRAVQDPSTKEDVVDEQDALQVDDDGVLEHWQAINNSRREHVKESAQAEENVLIRGCGVG
jgi:predicted SnoaL-like aldol condensation-catalyzing enzyme